MRIPLSRGTAIRSVIAGATALLLLGTSLVLWPGNRPSTTTGGAQRPFGAPTAASAATVPQDLNGLTAGTDYRTDALLVLFRDESGVDTPAVAQAAIAAMAAADPVIAGTDIQDIVAVFDTTPGVPNRDRKLALGMDRHFRLRIPPETDIVALINAFADEADVETAQAEAILSPSFVPNDPYYNRAPLPESDWQWNHQNLHSEAAWDVTQGNTDVVIATIDGFGFEFGHPELVENTWQNLGEDTDQDGVIENVGGTWQYDADDLNGVDDDGNGFIDDLIGWDFGDGTTGSHDVSPETGDGAHGTLVTGTAGARGNNGIGVAGVCWTCSLMYVQPSDDGWGPAIVYAADNGADVIVLSWSGISDEEEHQAIQYAVENGAVFIGGAGNNRTTLAFPGAFDEALSVAGTWSNDTRAGDPNNPASGSAWGTKADVAAPWETWSTGFSGSVEFTGGTSISGPMVAGAIGLLKAKEPTLRRSDPGTISDATLVAKVRSAVQGSIDLIYVPSGTPARYIGTGRLNIEELLGRTGYPVGVLDPGLDDRMVSQGTQLVIQGTAAGDFGSYTVAYGSGVYPTTWTEIASSTTPVENGTLATLYASSLPGPGDYTIRLAVYDPAGDLVLDDTIIHYGPFQDLAAAGEIWSSPVFADLDDDGQKEIIVGDYSGKVFAWKNDGTVLSGWPQSTSFALLSSPTVANADADPYPEILIGGRNGKLYAWDVNGTPLSGWPKTLAGSPTMSTPAIGDVDGDGYPEIFIGTSVTVPASGYLYGFEHDGSPILALTRSLEGQVDTSPAIGDVDGDGQLEVVVAIGDPLPKIHVFNADGTEPAGWPQSFGILKPGSPVLGNLDADAAMEVIVGQRGDYGDGEVRAYDNNGTQLWSTSTGGPLSLSPALADVDNDGALDIVVGNNASQLTVLDHAGTPLPGWPQTTSGPIHFSSPAVADIDNDGRNEIAIGVYTPNRPFYIFEDDGTLAPGWPVDTRSATGGGIGSSPAIGDLNQDGNVEIAVGTTSYVRIWTLGTPLNVAKAEWTMYRHDAQHTGLYGKSCTVTLNGQCAALQKPLLCNDGLMVPTCGLCGCPGGQPQCLPSGYCSQGSQCRPSCEFE